MIKSQYRQHLSGVSHVFIGQGGAALLSLLTQVVIARSLGPELRGSYAIHLILATTAHLLTFFGAEFGVRFLLLKQRISHADAIALLATLVLASCLLGSALLMVSFSWLSEAFVSKSALSALLMVVIHTFAVQLNVLLTIQQQFKSASALAVLHELTKCAFVLVSLSFFVSLEAAFLSQSLASLFVSIICMVYGGSGPINRIWVSWSSLRFAYLHGLKCLMYVFSNFGVVHGPTAVLSVYVSASSVGLFAVAYGLVSRIQIIPDALNRYLVPTLNQSQRLSEQQANLRVAVLALFLICCVVLTLLIVGSNQIARALFGSAYADAGPLLAILAVGFCARTVSKPLEAFINEVKGSPLVVSAFQAITLVATLMAIGLVADVHEEVGAAVVTTSGLIVSAVCLWLIFARMIRQADEKDAG